jgi:glycosyltransferase involved in cell wall biosynthesis
MIENPITKIVIIVPILNEEKSLGGALERKTFAQFKVIFIDFGTKDRSIKMVSNWVSLCRTKNKIKVARL